MKHPISEVAFTPKVKEAQEKRGSRSSYARMEERGEQGPWRDVVTPELAKFIAEQDSLYLGTAGADGQPYIQYRGGPQGFLKVLDENKYFLSGMIGLDVKALRSQSAEVATKHLRNSLRTFLRLVEVVRSLDRKKMEILISSRDYEELDWLIFTSLMGE